MNTSSKVHSHHHDIDINNEVDEDGHHCKLHTNIALSIISSRIGAF